MTACIVAGRAERGEVLRQDMPQHGCPSLLPKALTPLPGEEGGGLRLGMRRPGPGWRGEMEAQQPTSPSEQLGENIDQGAFVFFFCNSSPTPTRTHRYTQVLVRPGDFPALAQGAWNVFS